MLLDTSQLHLALTFFDSQREMQLSHLKALLIQGEMVTKLLCRVAWLKEMSHWKRALDVCFYPWLCSSLSASRLPYYHPFVPWTSQLWTEPSKIVGV